jgi:hypothetical protein
MPRKRIVHSERVDLIEKAREAMLAAVQLYNNPLVSFKTESFIVLSSIAWTYLLHAYLRTKRIEYRYFTKVNQRRKFTRNADCSTRHWDLKECISREVCPLDKNTINNLLFLIGLRNQVEHKKAVGLDSYLSARYQACALSARYQACALNFNNYLKKLHGEKYGLDHNLALSLQFAELDYEQSQVIKDKENRISEDITSYIAAFDSRLSNMEIENDRFAYRLLFVRVTAKRRGQADRVIEFIDPKSELAKSVSKDYWVKEETEKPKFSATEVTRKVREAGLRPFSIHDHTVFWQKHDGKNPSKGYGTMVVKTWCWYQNWITFVISELQKEKEQQETAAVKG